MIGYIKKLLEPKEAPPPDIEALAGQLLRTLPRCTARVVVASPNYGDQRYRADIVADTVSLLSWAEHHAQAVLGLRIPAKLNGDSDDVERCRRRGA